MASDHLPGTTLDERWAVADSEGALARFDEATAKAASRGNRRAHALPPTIEAC